MTSNKPATVEELERMLDLKITDWLDACGDIDKLKNALEVSMNFIYTVQEMKACCGYKFETSLKALTEIESIMNGMK